MSQPDTPLTADDLDIAAQATVYTGDPIVHREDTDGDGRVDRIEVDYDADGDADLIERDTDGDGRFDDTWVTTNTSSNVTGFADNDGDGHYERVLRDTDGDGVSDGVEEDLDGDGVADRFGLGLGPDDPFGEPEVWIDRLPEPRDGMTADDAAGFPPLRGPDDLDVPDAAVADPGLAPLVADAGLAPLVGADHLDAAVADPGFGTGVAERDMDYEQEAVNAFGESLRDAPTDEEAAAYVDPLAGRYVIEEQQPIEPDLPSTEASQDELDAANAVNDGPYGPAAEPSDVDSAYAEPAFPPLAEASDVDDAMADPGDDAYVG